jgi:hypothetical protein
MSFFFLISVNWLSFYYLSSMSTGQPESGNGGRHTIARDRMPSPVRDPTPPEPVKASATVPSCAGSCQPGSQQHDPRPMIMPHADGCVYFIYTCPLIEHIYLTHFNS